MEIWFHSEIKNPKGLCIETTQKYCVSIMPEINIAERKSTLKYSIAGNPPVENLQPQFVGPVINYSQ